MTDTRPPIDFSSRESLLRTDLTPEERTYIKHRTFMEAYGGSPRPFKPGTVLNVEPEKLVIPREGEPVVGEEQPTTPELGSYIMGVDPGCKEGDHSVSLRYADYSAVEKRVAAQMMAEGTMSLQADEAVRHKGHVLVSMLKALDAFATEHGITVTGLETGENIAVSFPDGMPLDTQVDLATKLAALMADLKDTPPPMERPVMTLAPRLVRTFEAAVKEAGIEVPRPKPADHAAGEINRVCHYIAQTLRLHTGLLVNPGDMLMWHEGEIHVRGDFGVLHGPISMDLLPTKTQRRALRVKP